MKLVPLSEVATIDRVGVHPGSLPADTKYLGLEHIERGGRIAGHDTVAGALITSAKFRFSADHVLFGKLRPNLGKIARPNFDGVCSTDILPIRPSAALDRAYLTHFLRQPEVVGLAAARAAGVNLPRLNPKVLATFPVPLPSINEQRRIAAILDHADALRGKRRQVLAHLDALTQSIFHDMFGPIKKSTWDQIPLGELVPKIESGKSPNCEARPAAADEWGVLKLSAVTYGQFRAGENKAFIGEVGSMEANEVRPGDVLMTRKNTRELVGAVARVHDVRPGLLLPDLVFRLHLDDTRVDSAYFQTLMMLPSKRQAVRGLSSGSAASMPNISKTRLATLPLELPPLDLQREFRSLTEGIENQRQAVHRAIAIEDELFASLQSRAFRGEL